ncbi:DUF2142 domain-containing protein [Cellulomonas sp. NS3]|uniref:DUF2142 domain-containing protein n=1 Tax=Cellulomonas sp. NS3 TaxID=2973977 RepID=UPI002163C38C|nr:DUF2142 domain-containing protein [Cellulomonas sp. NS3]
MNLGALRSRHGLLAKGLGALFLLMALGTWAVASPVGASPDEDYHLVSIWCGQGLRDGVCEAADIPQARTIPHALLESPCYNFHPETSAQCQAAKYAVDVQEMVPTERGNFVGDYPPVFYAAMSVFVGDDISLSVIVIRLVNALVFVLVLGAVYVASVPGLRRALLLGTAVTAVPLGMFLVPSANPSSWAILAVPSLLVAVLGYVTTDERRRRWLLGGLAALAVLLGAGARGDAAMYCAVAVGAALILTFRPDLRFVHRAAYPVVLAVVSVAAFLSAGQSSAAGGAEAPPLTVGRIMELMTTVPELWVGGLGYWELGWLDTVMPPLVWVLCWGMYAAVVYAAIGYAGLQRGLAISAVALALWLVPAYIQYLSGAPVGAYVQPRYILPLVTLLAVTALVRLDGQAFRVSPAQRWILVAALSVANATALHTNIRRYVTGSDVGGPDLDERIEWWWGGPVSPLSLWFLGAVAFAVGLALVSAELARDALARGTADEAPAEEASTQRPQPAGPAAHEADEDATVEPARTARG